MVERFWSRIPGKFVNSATGEKLEDSSLGRSTRQWYEMLADEMLAVTVQVFHENGGNPVLGCSWQLDALVKPIVAASISYEPDASVQPTIGAIGEDMPGLLCNVPVTAPAALYATGRVELHRRVDGQDSLIGLVTVLDHPPS